MVSLGYFAQSVEVAAVRPWAARALAPGAMIENSSYAGVKERSAIRRAVPEVVESIGYRMPGYELRGKPMLYFAGFKEHYSLFAASGTVFAALEDDLRGYELRKGTVHFPLTKPVPVKLISRIAKLRAAGIAATPKKPLQGREKEMRKSAQ